MKEIVLWGARLPVESLPQADIEYLTGIATMERPPVEWIWQEMNRVWDALGIDNRLPLQGQSVDKFYAHPVWVVNGVFTSADPVSVLHRDSIASFISKLGLRRVADYGGGFGELAKRLRTLDSDVQVDIVEPYPSKIGMQIVEGEIGIRFVKQFDNQYDCVIAQDVLEHVELPMELAAQMVGATRHGGYLIFANCFYPMIKCHLPSTFYLRHIFPWVVRAMGLKFLKRVEGANHALVFQRVGQIDMLRVNRFVAIAKVIGPILNGSRSLLRAINQEEASA